MPAPQLSVSSALRALPLLLGFALMLASAPASALRWDPHESERLPSPGAPPRFAQEVVFSDFDLAGWKHLGQLELESSALDMGNTDDLFDRNMGTQARVASENPARFVVRFASPRVVRRVVLAPGTPDSYAVSLAVVKADGGRFAAGELVVSDADAVFRLRDVPVRSFELTVERLERDDYVHVAEIRVNGKQTISALELDDLPTTLPEGGSFPVRISGRDDFGGRPDLTPIARLVVNPARAVALLDNRRAVTRVGGPLSLSARLGQLQGPMQPLLVQPLAGAPQAPITRPAFGYVELSFEGEPPFEVLRRGAGEKNANSIGITHASRFLDQRVEPGAAYQYSVRRVDRFGNALSKSSAEGRARTHSRTPEHTLTPGRFPVLVVLYVDSMSAEEAQDIELSIEAARLFLYRHSGGGMILEPQLLRLSGPTPSTAGPSMEGVEADLRRRGLRDDAFGAVFAVSNDIEGSFGNFPILGRAGGAMGRSADVVTPDGPLGPDPRFAWVFVHELWHAVVERAALAANIQGVPSAHFADDFARGLLGAAHAKPFDAGDAWDGQAALLADVDFWSKLGAPYRLPLATLDTDGDGLPDDDARLPMDERRFGSDPQRADSDGDGLDDWAELAAGLYSPSHPQRPDTDGDGLPDGNDAWPLANFRGEIVHGELPALLAAGPDPARPDLELLASWTAEALLLRLVAPAPADVFLEIDGSGELGRWESDARVADTQSADVWAGSTKLALRATHDPRGVFVGSRELPEASLTATLADDGRWHLDLRLPRELGPGARDVLTPESAERTQGLRLRAGQRLGFTLSARPPRIEESDPFDAHPQGEPWTGLFETHRFYDAILLPPAAPEAASEPDADTEPEIDAAADDTPATEDTEPASDTTPGVDTPAGEISEPAEGAQPDNAEGTLPTGGA